MKKIRTTVHRSSRVSFLVPASGDDISSYQDLDNAGIGKACTVKISVIDTFGPVAGE